MVVVVLVAVKLAISVSIINEGNVCSVACRLLWGLSEIEKKILNVRFKASHFKWASSDGCFSFSLCPAFWVGCEFVLNFLGFHYCIPWILNFSLLFVSLYHCLFLYMSLPPFVPPIFYVSIYLSLSLCISLSLTLCLSLPLFFHLCLYLCLSISLTLSPSTPPSPSSFRSLPLSFISLSLLSLSLHPSLSLFLSLSLSLCRSSRCLFYPSPSAISLHVSLPLSLFLSL